MSDDGKSGAFYSAVLQAWIDSRMEADRTILALSAAGLGLLVTLITSVKVISDTALVIFGLGSLAFVGAVFVGLVIFRKHGPYLQKLATCEDGEKENAQLECEERDLRRLDVALVGLFVVGIVCTLVAGVLAALALK